jgi:glycosyltransferase involved in cell wall biosynthesis
VKRLALLADRYPPEPGGLAVSARRIATSLAAAGHAVDVLAVSDGLPGTVVAANDDGVRVLRTGAHRREEDTSAAVLDLVVRRHHAAPYDAILGFYLVRSGFLAAYAGRYLGIPSVVSARGNDLDRAALDPARGTRVLKALELATRVAAVTSDLARKARALAPAADVRTVPNAVDTAVFRPTPADPARRRALALEGRAVVGFVGELRKKKGVVPLVAALARLAARRKVTLLCAGGIRPEDEGVLLLARREQPALHALVLPWCGPGELRSLYALMDVVAHPSLDDGMPNAVLEAMACGRPVVGSDAGGIPDVVRPGRDGLLVPKGDAAALADAVEGLLADPARAAALGAAARARVEAEFTPARERRAYERLCRGARAPRRRGRGGRPAPAPM